MSLRIGATYPQIELGGDPAAVRQLGLATESLGYDHLVVYDHVVGAEHADRDPALWGPYTEHDPFHDPFVMFGYLAAITQRIELVTGIVILPQRQTVLAAQQAADVDLLSGERLRLGVGSGWNYVEYHALGQDFETRGRRLSEQVEFLRALWSEPLLTYDGEFDRIERGNINPRPKRQIPIWMGGFNEPAFRRAAQLGDGFIFAGPVQRCLDGMERVRHHLAEAGRSADDFGLEMLGLREPSADAVVEAAERWAEAGGTHFSAVSMGNDLTTADAHEDYYATMIDRLRAAVG